MSNRLLKIALFFSMVSPPFVIDLTVIFAPQAESVVGVAVFAVYLLLHFCALQVRCPANRAEEVAFVFYTTYIKNTGGCTFDNKIESIYLKNSFRLL